MEWVTNNFIANLHKGDFLAFYLVVITAILLACRWSLRSSDPTRGMTPPPVPQRPDPYEIAYLRGGENEVTRVVVFALLQRGYLELSDSDKKLARVSDPPDPGRLSPLKKDAFEYFDSPRTARDVFSGGLPRRIKLYCGPYQQWLESEHLLSPPEVKSFARRVGLVGAAIILGLGSYKFWVATDAGLHNVGFLTAMAIVSIPLLVVVCRTPYFSHRGRAYIQQLRKAFEQFKGRANSTPADADTALLLLGVFGVSALAGTPHAYYQKMFPQSGSGGSGSGCGSSGSCGGGGDGGGGGCGGGCGGGGCGG